MNQEVTHTKKCSKCQTIKSVNEFGKDKNRNDRFACYCKKCRSIPRKIKPKILFSKKCPKCNKIKCINDFGKNKSKITGYQDYCKSCRTIYYTENKDKIGLYHKKRYWKTPEKFRKEAIEYRQNNQDKKHLQDKNYQLMHPKQYKTYQKQYGKIWRSDPKNKLKRRQQAKIRYDSEPAFKLLGNLRCRMRYALKNNQKCGHTIKLLMCTVDDWRKHLEGQFTEGMSWNNYGNKKGQWTVDHIIPCDFFNLIDPVEQYMCFRWQNTQPMWHVKNLSKGNKLIIK